MHGQNGAGLNDIQVRQLLTRYGPNELPRGEGRNWRRLAFEIIREPMFLLLVTCGLIYFFLGNTEEAILLLSFVVLTMAISFHQQRKTDKAVESLRVLSAPYATVVRNGEHRRVPSTEVVPGDILIVREGDRVCADAVLENALHLAADESLLTGESVPVAKLARTGVEEGSVQDDWMVFSGTLIVSGEGTAKVIATGTNTELGKIGSSLGSIKPEPTLLEQETKRMVRLLASVGLLLCGVSAATYAIVHHNIVEGLLAGITLAMALIPEELPVVFTLFLTLGAWRMSQYRVLTRRPPAIETLGAASVLCTDKTGTLTENRMTVAEIIAGGEVTNIAHGEHITKAASLVLEYANLACTIDPYDPMERAIVSLSESYGLNTAVLTNWQLVKTYPLTKQLLAVTHVWRTDDLNVIAACKGAPEAVAHLCKLNQAALEEVTREVNRLAESGMRVLAVAASRLTRAGEDDGEGQAEFHSRADVGSVWGNGMPNSSEMTAWDEQLDTAQFSFEWLGLIGLRDPVRSSVPQAVEQFRSAGIRIVMITGDYPVTAQSIAKEAGLPNTHRVLTGEVLDKLSDVQLSKVAKEVDIFARIVPDQKLRIVNALKASGAIVAMTGDGINDAPALKAAHIGIAMGLRGTDVAREAASLVLLDDDFAAIATAIKLGRRIYDNLKKAFVYVLAIHIPIIGLSILPILLQFPPILLPAHVVFMELIIDPACSVAFEAEPAESDVMQRPPRDVKQRIFQSATVMFAGLQGLTVLLAALVVYFASMAVGLDERVVRGLTFAALISSNVSLILVNRSLSSTIFRSFRRQNKAVWYIVLAAFVLLPVILYTPLLQDLFLVTSIPVFLLMASIILGFTSVLWIDAVKRARRPG
ncbi:cation-translocating P-type ATPase [Alicyclobacillus curvatus]|nr:cation-translocating P-type ATPase [Alicyclobacillus curvatus]